ncbi:MAG TPA: hypothetical protein VMF89_03415, partial [Polyangiales bacterium]|nr:hypothetical protein [Polyangiales bacterium]
MAAVFGALVPADAEPGIPGTAVDGEPAVACVIPEVGLAGLVEASVEGVEAAAVVPAADARSAAPPVGAPVVFAAVGLFPPAKGGSRSGLMQP